MTQKQKETQVRVAPGKRSEKTVRIVFQTFRNETNTYREICSIRLETDSAQAAQALANKLYKVVLEKVDSKD